MAKRTIVVGVDGSVGSDAAVRWCVATAPLLDAQVVVVHALPAPIHLVPPTVNAPTAYGDDDAIRSGLTDTLKLWSVPLSEGNVEYETRLVDGGAAETLMRVATEVQADLLVVGRRGHGGFAELLLGSVPHTLSRHADLPVVIVPVASNDHPR